MVNVSTACSFNDGFCLRGSEELNELDALNGTVPLLRRLENQCGQVLGREYTSRAILVLAFEVSQDHGVTVSTDERQQPVVSSQDPVEVVDHNLDRRRHVPSRGHPVLLPIGP